MSGVTFIEGCPHVRGDLYRGVSTHWGGGFTRGSYLVLH